MLTLHNLAKNKAQKKNSKRLGRGSGSGAGNYSGRGMKGQKARSGGKSGLTSKSIKGYLLRIPKVRGFKSFYDKWPIVNTGDLNQAFNNGELVNLKNLIKKELLHRGTSGYKILGKGQLSKNLKIEANAFSKSALEQIKKTGGEAIVVAKKSAVVEREQAKKNK